MNIDWATAVVGARLTVALVIIVDCCYSTSHVVQALKHFNHHSAQDRASLFPVTKLTLKMHAVMLTEYLPFKMRNNRYWY